ncbi:MAG: hypothetical protein HUU38_14025 [Anaerolineales bacterium]|nr:hypothetical protein [Anaerolineales bacterium]
MPPEFDAILASDLPDLEKLTQAYQFILKEQIAIAQREIELQKALGDQEKMIKEKIKKGTIEYSASIFSFCFLPYI